MNLTIKKALSNNVLVNNLMNENIRVDVSSNTAEITLRLINKNGYPKVVPAEVVNSFDRNIVMRFMSEQGLYVYPTLELVTWFSENVLSRHKIKDVIEVGAGNGVLSKSLGIRATDNFSQSNKYKPVSKYRDLWEQSQQSMELTGNRPVKYGPNVLMVEGVEAVKRFKPSCVIGCFITDMYRLEHDQRGGNVFGMDEIKIINRVNEYFMVGNLKTHRRKLIREMNHKEIKIHGIVTRAEFPELDRIFFWKS